MRIVTDGDKFAIEKGWIFKKYKSLYTTGSWWPREESEPFCWGTKEQIKNIWLYEILGTPRSKLTEVKFEDL